MTVMTRHSNRRVIVTGGSRGIGLGISRMFAREGAEVAIIGRDLSTGKQIEDTLRAEGGRVHFVPGDLTELENIPQLANTAREKLDGTIDIFCHCAGIYPVHTLSEMKLSDWHAVMNTNLTSAMAFTREFLSDLEKSPYGRVIFISSITGPRTGIAGLSHYGASKGALEALTRALAVELGPLGITANCVAPGTIMTDTLRELYTDEAEIDEVRSRIPVRTLGKPEDIAAAVSFLASSDASFITGISIVVDGGQTLPEVQ